MSRRQDREGVARYVPGYQQGDGTWVCEYGAPVPNTDVAHVPCVLLDLARLRTAAAAATWARDTELREHCLHLWRRRYETRGDMRLPVDVALADAWDVVEAEVRRLLVAPLLGYALAGYQLGGAA